MVKHYLHIAGVFLLSMMVLSCQKADNKLEGSTLNNPFSYDSGIELIQIDSIVKYYGPSNYIKGYYSINYEYFKDTSQIKYVIVYRNEQLKYTITPPDRNFFVDFTLLLGGTYNYQLLLFMKDDSKTKLSVPYYITY